MFFKENILPDHKKRYLFRAEIACFLLVVFSFFLILSARIGEAGTVAPVSCALEDQPAGWRCPDIKEGTKGGSVYSSIVATRMIDDVEKLAEIRQAMCSLYDRLENRKTRKEKIPYQPFLLELQGKNGNTWSMHIGCSQNKAQSMKVLNDVRQRYCALPERQKPYLFAKPLDSVSLQQPYRVPPGRGISKCKENYAQHDFINLPIREKRSINQPIHLCPEYFIKQVLDSDTQLKHDHTSQKKADIYQKNDGTQEDTFVALFPKKTKISFSDLHEIAANITEQYRKAGLACSEAVVLRGEQERQIGIRICEFDEGKEDCRCPVLYKPTC